MCSTMRALQSTSIAITNLSCLHHTIPSDCAIKPLLCLVGAHDLPSWGMFLTHVFHLHATRLVPLVALDIAITWDHTILDTVAHLMGSDSGLLAPWITILDRWHLNHHLATFRLEGFSLCPPFLLALLVASSSASLDHVLAHLIDSAARFFTEFQSHL